MPDTKRTRDMKQLGNVLLAESRPYERRSWSIATAQVTATLLLAATAWTGLVWAAKAIPLAVPFLIPFAAGMLLRLFMIQHDCSHNSFLPSDTWNTALGRLLGILTLTPFDAWKATHSYHHSAPGHLDKRGIGDILTLTTEEYLALSSLRQALYRLYRNPAFLLFLGAPFAFLFLYRLPTQGIGGQRAVASVVRTNLGVFLVWGLGVWCYGAATFALIYIPMVWLAAATGAWFFFVQHQFADTYWATGEEWDFYTGALLGSSHLDLPGWANWLTGDIALHHVHHLNPRIPNYQLRSFVHCNPILTAWPRLTWLAALRATRLTLWDPVQRRLVAFPPPTDRQDDDLAPQVLLKHSHS